MKVDDDLVRQVIRPRLRESHKGSYGRVLLVGGLYPYGGAIIMAAIACVNSGAVLVTVATDRENIIALHAHLPEAMAFDLRETERFLDNLRAADVVLIGSGLGEEETACLLYTSYLIVTTAMTALLKQMEKRRGEGRK